MQESPSTKLNRVIHQKARLGIMSILMVKNEADFNYLKQHLKLSDGNLSSHITVLEKQDYVKIEKKFIDKKPKTICYITDKGKKEYKKYIEELEKIINTIKT